MKLKLKDIVELNTGKVATIIGIPHKPTLSKELREEDYVYGRYTDSDAFVTVRRSNITKVLKSQPTLAFF